MYVRGRLGYEGLSQWTAASGVIGKKCGPIRLDKNSDNNLLSFLYKSPQPISLQFIQNKSIQVGIETYIQPSPFLSTSSAKMCVHPHTPTLTNTHTKTQTTPTPSKSTPRWQAKIARDRTYTHAAHTGKHPSTQRRGDPH